jgi:hypothetical protein
MKLMKIMWCSNGFGNQRPQLSEGGAMDAKIVCERMLLRKRLDSGNRRLSSWCNLGTITPEITRVVPVVVHVDTA